MQRPRHRNPRIVAIAGLLLLLAVSPLNAAGPPLENPEEVMHRLELGMEALAALGRDDERRMLEGILEDLRNELAGDRKRDRPRPRRLERQIETLELARAALREAERNDAAEMIQRAIEARAAVLEGDRDGIDERSPSAGQIRELLGLAGRVYREFGVEQRAAQLHAMAERLWPERETDRARRRDDARRDRRPERPALREEVEIMRLAVPALAEHGRADAAEIIERAVRARMVDLEGMRGPEVDAARERAPRREAVIEALALASRHWTELGHERKAQLTGRLAEEMAAALAESESETESERDRPRPDRPRPDRQAERSETDARYERLLHRLEEIEVAMQSLRDELRRIRRGPDR